MIFPKEAPKKLLLAAFVVLALSASACSDNAASTDPLPVFHTVEKLELESSLGETVTAADLQGSLVIADFIFTSCPMACPAMTSQMKRLYREFEGENVRFLSITTDPQTDTREVLHDFAQSLDVDERRWIFGRTDETEVRRLSEKEFLLAAAGFPAGHSLKFVLLDQARQIRGYYDSDDLDDLERLRKELAELLRET